MAEEDIIYGKNRHLFGGIQPSNLSNFNAVWDSGKNALRLNFVTPNDTIIDGQTVCSYAGTVFVYRGDRYPVDEFDGVTIANVKGPASSTLVSGLDQQTTYFFAAFPYSTQGVYNRNILNRCAYNEPADLISFTAERIMIGSNAAKVRLNIEAPGGLKGVTIRRSINRYPTSLTDGDAFMDIEDNIPSQVEDTDVEADKTYYYSAFPFTNNDEGDRIYNLSYQNNCASVLIKLYGYLYGFDIDLDDPDPDTRVTYPADVDNANYSKAYMDSTKFNYGGWTLSPGEDFMPKPCMLTYDGVVDHYLDPTNYSKREDGVSNSKISDTSFNGNAMMEWPKIYTKREVIGNVYKFRCSDMKFDDDWDCWCNYDKNNNEIDHFYTAIYEASYTGNKLRSLGGISPVSKTTTMTLNGYRTNARANGDDWGIYLIADHLLIQDLFVLMFKTTDCQSTLGKGNVNSSLFSPGNMNDKGLFYGNINSDAQGIKLFGMEHLWGNSYIIVDGLFRYYNDVDNGEHLYHKITRGTHDGSTASDYNNDGTGYIDTDHESDRVFSSTERYFLKHCEAYGRFPASNISMGSTYGSTSTYECDITNIDYATGDEQIAIISYGSGDDAGIFGYWFEKLYDETHSNTATYISCKPTRQV